MTPALGGGQTHVNFFGDDVLSNNDASFVGDNCNDLKPQNNDMNNVSLLGLGQNAMGGFEPEMN